MEDSSLASAQSSVGVFYINLMKKKCNKCEIKKPLTQFYPHKSTKDKLTTYCKQCFSIRRIKYHHNIFPNARYNDGRIKNPEYKKEKRKKYKKLYRKKYPLKVKARNAVKYLFRIGKLKRLPCEICAKIKTEFHHEDYSRPLEVRHLCRKHHLELHNVYI